MIIGITGSIGSGKTTVANLFKKCGFNVIDVDKMYKHIYKKNKSLRDKIKKEFNTINRNKLKKTVFKNYKKLRRLNEITHPVIINEIKREIKRIYNQNKIIIDVPLLIETKEIDLVDKIVVVKCNGKTQIARVLKKGKYTKKEIKNIMKSQMPLKEKLKYADFVIDNSYSLSETKRQIREMIKKI